MSGEEPGPTQRRRAITSRNEEPWPGIDTKVHSLLLSMGTSERFLTGARTDAARAAQKVLAGEIAAPNEEDESILRLNLPPSSASKLESPLDS